MDRVNAYVLEINNVDIKVGGATQWSDEAQVLGFGCWMQTSIGKTFVAYFAGSRASAETAPDYARQLWLVIDSSIFDLSSGPVSIDLKQSVTERSFTVRQENRTIAALRYKYPFHRGLTNKLLGDPFLAEPDLLGLVIELAKSPRSTR
ncbi:MAG TPA: hypothetical protein VGD45_16330 [Steroidobacter sp.]|uniref:hypothetical protein n=1 Tax=Steroidobacter sp. TaxID=1978227 RepID=UPI002ED7C61F